MRTRIISIVSATILAATNTLTLNPVVSFANGQEVNGTTAIIGDVNGDGRVDSSDASRILGIYACLSTGTAVSYDPEIADCNGDGAIDSSDASLALSYYSHLSTGGAPDSFGIGLVGKRIERVTTVKKSKFSMGDEIVFEAFSWNLLDSQENEMNRYLRTNDKAKITSIRVSEPTVYGIEITYVAPREELAGGEIVPKVKEKYWIKVYEESATRYFSVVDNSGTALTPPITTTIPTTTLIPITSTTVTSATYVTSTMTSEETTTAIPATTSESTTTSTSTATTTTTSTLTGEYPKTKEQFDVGDKVVVKKRFGWTLYNRAGTRVEFISYGAEKLIVQERSETVYYVTVEWPNGVPEGKEEDTVYMLPMNWGDAEIYFEVISENNSVTTSTTTTTKAPETTTTTTTTTKATEKTTTTVTTTEATTTTTETTYTPQIILKKKPEFAVNDYITFNAYSWNLLDYQENELQMYFRKGDVAIVVSVRDTEPKVYAIMFEYIAPRNEDIEEKIPEIHNGVYWVKIESFDAIRYFNVFAFENS